MIWATIKRKGKLSPCRSFKSRGEASEWFTTIAKKKVYTEREDDLWVHSDGDVTMVTN